MPKKIQVSIIMPTYNSAKTIEKSFISIREQKFNQEEIEIMVIDGGSSDRTRELAKKYGARIIENKMVQQEYAKHLGILQAKGDYAIFLDSDEAFSSKNAIKNRVSVLENHPEIQVVLSGGYKKPDNFSSINDYINNFADPFAFFMNGINSDYRRIINSWKRRYKSFEEKEKFVKFRFLENDILPISDMCAGNTINLRLLRSKPREIIENEQIVPQLFYIYAEETGNAALLKDDSILHYSADSYKKYFGKIRWRVIVNIHYKNIPGTGFSNRESFQPFMYNMKKYLFIPYAITLIMPLIVTMYYCIKWRNSTFFIHFPLTVYTAIIILWQYFLKLLNKKPQLTTYGGGRKVLDVQSK